MRDADWKRFRLAVPGASAPVEYHAADLGNVLLNRAVSGRLIAAQTGGIRELHPGTAFVITSRTQDGLKHILESAAWARWIRPAVRKKEREALLPKVEASRQIRRDGPTSEPPQVLARANILLSRRQDESIPWDELKLSLKPRDTRGVLASLKRVERH